MIRKHKNYKDVKYIINHLREEDKHECMLSEGKKFKKKIVNQIMKSNEYMVMGVSKKDNTPVCIGGVHCVADGIGIIWLLSTKEIEKHQISLLKNIKKELEYFDKKYWLTYNLIYKENHIAKNWLKKYGYRFPQEEKEKNFMDNQLMKFTNVSEDFELFYRTKTIRGLQ